MSPTPQSVSGSSTFREGMVLSIVFLSRKRALAHLRICKHSDGKSGFSLAFQASLPDNLGLVENVGAVHYDVSRKVYLNIQGPDVGSASEILRFWPSTYRRLELRKYNIGEGGKRKLDILLCLEKSG